MVSIVNGFVCYSCCDAAKAKRGEDPAKKLGDIEGNQQNRIDGSRDPAVIFAGALKDASDTAPVVNGVASVTATVAGTTPAPVAQQNVVDVFA
jgi:hypothetical protein